MNEIKIKAEKHKWSQQVYYCPYCSRTNLLYLWKDNLLLGLGLDKWLYCSKCKRKFTKGVYGIHEQKLDVKIENQKQGEEDKEE